MEERFNSNGHPVHSPGRSYGEDEMDLFKYFFLVWGGLAIASVSAWITHVVVCIQTEQWFFLIAGAIAFPIAIVHGVGIWFGAW